VSEGSGTKRQQEKPTKAIELGQTYQKAQHVVTRPEGGEDTDVMSLRLVVAFVLSRTIVVTVVLCAAKQVLILLCRGAGVPTGAR
jgi:hypothetical protein